MTDMRVENEVKFVSDGGPFDYDGSDPGKPMELLKHALSDAGMSFGDYRVMRFRDEYYDDPEGSLLQRGVVLRFRDRGGSASVTIKQPYVRDGLGLSRKEIETDLLVPGQKIAAVRDHAEKYLGNIGIGDAPVLTDEVTRCEMRISSEVRKYRFGFDRVIFGDPVSGLRSGPSYEIEIESYDHPIKYDRTIVRLAAILSDKYMFEEIRVGKFVRGKAWISSLAH